MFASLTALSFLSTFLTDPQIIRTVADMGISERKEREKEALRERILDATLELVTSDGPDALTMRRLAERIEYSATAIYAHFADKDALLSSLCRREFCDLAAHMADFAPSGHPLDDLRLLGKAYCHFALKHPQAYRLMFLLPGMPSRPEKTADEVDAYNICVQSVARARTAGVLRDELGDDELVAQTLWAALHGVLALQIVKHDKGIPWHTIEARIDSAVDIMVEGLRKR